MDEWGRPTTMEEYDKAIERILVGEHLIPEKHIRDVQIKWLRKQKRLLKKRTKNG